MENYTVVIRPDDNGTFVAYIPAIPSCHAQGNTQFQAFNRLQGVFLMIKEEFEEENKSLPEDISFLDYFKTFN